MARRLYDEKQCWDATIFTSWLQGPSVTPGPYENLRALVTQAYTGNIYIITSAIVMAEILKGRLSNDAKEMLERFWKRRNVRREPVHNGVAMKAGEIRDFVRNRYSRNLETPDATILATAVIHKVDVLYTYDHDDLLRLDGDVDGYNLRIQAPPTPDQGALELGT